eukprot:1125305-Prymnesium_polylepis.1
MQVPGPCPSVRPFVPVLAGLPRSAMRILALLVCAHRCSVQHVHVHVVDPWDGQGNPEPVEEAIGGALPREEDRPSMARPRDQHPWLRAELSRAQK